MPPAKQQEESAPSKVSLPYKHQQTLLDIFNASFSDVLTSHSFYSTLQEIKTALFRREFATAFSKPEYLDAYAARWSPTRALGYASIFADSLASIAHNEPLRVISIGGCAAEQVAFASYLARRQLKGELVLIDSAPWGEACQKVQSALESPPPLSKYATEAKKTANIALLEPGQLSLTVKENDVLAFSQEEWATLIGKKPVAVTIMFTLNELYTAGGIGKATAFITKLVGSLPQGSLLILADSPGSYSEATVGKESRKYPISWLLEHALRQMEKQEGILLESVDNNSSLWFRIDGELDYPIQLENMRYQLQVFRVASTSACVNQS